MITSLLQSIFVVFDARLAFLASFQTFVWQLHIFKKVIFFVASLCFFCLQGDHQYFLIFLQMLCHLLRQRMMNSFYISIHFSLLYRKNQEREFRIVLWILILALGLVVILGGFSIGDEETDGNIIVTADVMVG